MDKTFPPSYPFMEELNNADKYMESRCPAWCDRILLNKHFYDLIENNSSDIVYNMIGEDKFMGDHKVTSFFLHFLFFLILNIVIYGKIFLKLLLFLFDLT
jgi:inositol polyphosphate 5-phosphatase INPP5A